MNQTLIRKIADAVLYEGYLLYPYRPSVKNRQRWTFGGLYPRAYVESAGTDANNMLTECLIEATEETTVRITVRFLHLMAREVYAISDLNDANEPLREPRERLEIEGRLYQTWQEATEREVSLGPISMQQLGQRATQREFTFPGSCQTECIRRNDGETAGVIVRRQRTVAGRVNLSAEWMDNQLAKLRMEVCNDTSANELVGCSRDEASLAALAATHAILETERGSFISLMDPPADRRAAATGCKNLGNWPVLVGEPGTRRTMLASPIILYDYPQIAEQSPGDMFDGTEIDEILSLRVLTLTEDEKKVMASVDEHARGLLERTQSLDAETMIRLHGTTKPVTGLKHPSRKP